jgi:tetratricopeptide (TPR) repeat protein
MLVPMSDSPRKKKRAKSESEAGAPRKKKRTKSESEAGAPRKKKKRTKSESEADAPRKKKRTKSESEADAPRKKKKRTKSESEADAPRKKKKRTKSESEADAPRKKKKRTKSESEADAPRKKKKRTKSDATPTAPGRRRGRQRDQEEDESQPKSGIQPLHIGLGVGVVGLLIVGVAVAFSGNGSAPKPGVPTPAAKTQVATKTPVRGGRKTQAPSKSGRKGPPRLPADPQQALKVIGDYEKEHPEDLGGLIELYDKLLKKLDPKAGASVERYVDKLRKRYAGEVGKKYGAYQKRAREKLDAEDFEGALGVWQEARAELRGDVRAAIDDEVRRITEIQSAMQGLVRASDKLPTAGRGVASPALLTQLGLMLQKHRAAKGTKAFKKVLDRAQRERAGYRGQRRDRGEARIVAIREALASHERARKEAWKARAKQAREASVKKPIKVGKRKRQLVSLSETEFTLSQGGARRFERDPKVTAQVLERACRPDKGSDLRELLVFCLKHRLFKTAARAAKRLAKVDPKLAGSLPDVEAMRRASRLFRGDRLRKPEAGFEGATYDFSVAGANELLGDFQPLPKEAGLSAKGGVLQVWNSRGGASAMFKEIALQDRLRFDISWPRSADGILEIRLDSEGAKGTRVGIYFSNGSRRAVKLLKRPEGGKRMDPEGEWLPLEGERVTIQLGGGRARLTAGGAESRETTIPTFSRALTLFGGIPSKAGQGVSIHWPGFAVSGRLASEWKRKSLLAYSATLYKALLETPLELEVAGVGGPGEKPLKLTSSDDPFALAGIGRDLRQAYGAAWKALREGKAKAGELEQAFTGVIQERGRLAGAYCGRGLARRGLKDWVGAEGDMDIAIGLDPIFYEALVARAQLRLLFGNRKGAEEDLRTALKQAPDLGGVHRGLGRIALQREDYPAARDAFGLALALDPKDSEARKYFLSVRQVAAGPPWEKTHEHQTKHFLVRTNTSAARAKQIGALLELARDHYKKVVGTSKEAGTQRARCLVFDTSEGFNTYAALTSIHGGLENVRGLYSPLYKQLLFYEDRNDTSGTDLKKTLFHEGFHRYADEVMPGIPMWASEGLADLFGAELTFENGILEGRLSNLETAISSGKAPRVRDLVRMDRKRFYADDSHINYAAAWTLCRYLVRGPAPATAKQAFRDFLAQLRDRVSPTKAFKKTFASVDLDALDRRWRKYVAALR